MQTPEYVRVERGAPGNPVLDVGGRRWGVVQQASLLTSTAPGGLTAPTLHPVKPAGCAPDDYGTLNLRGAIAVVDDAVCSVVDKQNAAVARGAVAVLVVSPPSANGARARCSAPATTNISTRRWASSARTPMPCC